MPIPVALFRGNETMGGAQELAGPQEPPLVLMKEVREGSAAKYRPRCTVLARNTHSWSRWTGIIF